MVAALAALCIAGSAAAQTQIELNQGAAASFHRADKDLNAKYELLLRRAGAHAAQFRAAQRAWIAFRDSECDFAASGAAGGSIYAMIFSQCLERLTRARIGAFDAYLACREGDLSCPTAP
jgi:uncharacterized protein YecT (DUF1311 family)